MTAILDQIKRMVERLVPAPVCGACLAGKIAGMGADQAGVAINELGGKRGFERNKAVCSLCGEQAEVIRKRR